MEYTDEIEDAIFAVKQANKHALTFAHPAYRNAEDRLRALGPIARGIALDACDGLNAVIGRGVRA